MADMSFEEERRLIYDIVVRQVGTDPVEIDKAYDRMRMQMGIGMGGTLPTLAVHPLAFTFERRSHHFSSTMNSGFTQPHNESTQGGSEQDAVARTVAGWKNTSAS
ncbi:hypothetical protein LTR17_002539 [Elasticomyces elasticus]|nr:hypothetical protein LTR17_002539 [Elasticomyces elasticus]